MEEVPDSTLGFMAVPRVVGIVSALRNRSACSSQQRSCMGTVMAEKGVKPNGGNARMFSRHL